MDFYKKANFYCILVPLLAAAWVLLTSSVFLKNANSEWEKTKAESDKSTRLIKQILELNPELLKMHAEREKLGRFDYNTEFHKFAQAHKILSSDYTPNVKKERRVGNTYKQGANLTIKNIDIQKISKFLSELLTKWPNLQCETLTLKKAKTGKDSWDATIRFQYTHKKRK